MAHIQRMCGADFRSSEKDLRKHFHYIQNQGQWSLSYANVRIFPERTGLNEWVLRDKIEDARSGPGMKGLTTGDDDPIVILNSIEDLKRHPVIKVDACINLF